jgi:hypothetical protein
MRIILRFCGTAALGAAILSGPLVVSAAQAEQKVGVAAAVKPTRRVSRPVAAAPA